jgi:hypothetical protein
MKTRYGFVSNSSSSSFFISLDDISGKQLRMLLALDNVSIGHWGDNWSITENDRTVSGYTNMDNGGEDDGLHRWMVDNNFDMNLVTWNNY